MTRRSYILIAAALVVSGVSLAASAGTMETVVVTENATLAS